MKKNKLFSPTKSISTAFLLVFIVIAVLLTYISSVTKNMSFDTRTKAVKTDQSNVCAGDGNTCMTVTKCSTQKGYNIGQLNCLGSLICCSSSPKPNDTQIYAPKPVIITPRGGELWERGKTYTIEWNEPVTTTSTSLFLYTRNTSGDTYLGPIAYYVSNKIDTNTYSWTIPMKGSSGTVPPDGNNIVLSVAQYDPSGNRIIEVKSVPFRIVTPL